MSEIFDATVAALEADNGGEGVKQEPAVSPAASEEQGENTVVSPATESGPEEVVETADQPEKEPDTDGAVETERLPDEHHRSAAYRIKELNEAKILSDQRAAEFEEKAQQYEAQLQEAAAAKQLLDYLQSDPEAMQLLTSHLTGQGAAQAEQERPQTIDDFIASYDDPAEARAAFAEYKADLAQQRIDSFMRQQQEAQSQQAQAQKQAQVQQMFVWAQGEIDKAIAASSGLLAAEDRSIIFEQARQAYLAGGVKAEDAVSWAVENLSNRYKAAHSRQMSEYAKSKTKPQPFIQGAGGAAPVPAPPDPTRKKSYMDDVNETAALLRGN